MIRTFRSRPLKALFEKDDASKIAADLVSRIVRRMDALNVAKNPDDMKIAGFNFHQLRGKPARYSVHVNGPWCITFGWDGEDAIAVDLENYH